MGYILPIQKDTYRQYANRINVLKEKNNTVVDPVRKPIFYKVNSQYTWEEMQKQNRPKFDPTTKTITKGRNSVNPQVLADVTGVGGLFNESI